MPRARERFGRACRPRPYPRIDLGCNATGTTEYAASGAHVYALEPSGPGSPGFARRVCRISSPNRLRSRAARAATRAIPRQTRRRPIP